MAVKKLQLDSTDRKIIEALRMDARKTFQEIGDAVGLSRPAARERVTRLEEAGVITGYHAEIDQAASGMAMHAMLTFKYDHDMDFHGKKPNDVVPPFLDSSPRVVSYWWTYGDLDFLIEASAETKEELDSFVDELRGYGFVKTHLILRYQGKH